MKQLFLRSISLCIGYVIPTIKINKAGYKENTDILKMFR